MSFIAKNPLSAAKVKSSPPSPMKGMRGLFPGEDGWYDIDDNGNITKLGSNSEEGADGKSAYEIAVEQGFEGSEQEWLDSLKGEPGAPGEKGEKGDKGDPYILTESDKTEISDIVSAEIEAELNAALLEIITIDEELLIPDGNEVAY